MPAYPTGSVNTTNLDSGSDLAGNARADLLLAVQKLNEAIASYATASGVCDLDSSGLVPSARLGFALKAANNLSDLGSAATARTNLGGTTIGKDIYTASSASSVRSLIAAMGTAGGTFTGAPSYASDPGSANVLCRKNYVDAQVGSKQDNVGFFVAEHREASGVGGGTCTAGSWEKRTINATVLNEIGASVVSSQITLPAGTYWCKVDTMTYHCGRCQTRIRNVSDGVDYNGLSRHTAGLTTGVSSAHAFFTIGSSKTFEVQTQVQVSVGTSGYGLAASFGAEVYILLAIAKF